MLFANIVIVFLSVEALSLQYYISSDVFSTSNCSYQLYYDGSGNGDEEHNGAIDNRSKSFDWNYRRTTFPDEQYHLDRTFYSVWNCNIDDYFVNSDHNTKHYHDHDKYSHCAYAVQCSQLHWGLARGGSAFGSVQSSARRKRRASS